MRKRVSGENGLVLRLISSLIYRQIWENGNSFPPEQFLIGF
jgi:hypothetical protein